MIYIDSSSHDPYFNLALEQYVFDNMDRSKEYFLLWQNENTIVVGKHQNTIGEINQKFVDEHKIKVVRRLSGGGTVYHDLGNLNFTIIVSQTQQMEDFEFAKFCQVVVKALAKLGVKAEINGRNDITINGKKFSGNSQYMKQGRIMHHGCILFDSDLSVLTKALKVSKDKIASKGIKSVASRVTNVAEAMEEKHTIAELKKALVEAMEEEHPLVTKKLTPEDLNVINKIKEERYATWEWNYGASPQYDLVKERYVPGCGKVEIHLNVQKGMIQGFDLFGDYFGNGDKSDLQNLLIGKVYKKEALSEALDKVDIAKYLHNMGKEDFLALLVE